MGAKTNIPLTATEMSNLWASYQYDSLSACVLKYFLANNGDADIHPILEYALQLSQNNLETVTNIFMKENIPIPAGVGNDL